MTNKSSVKEKILYKLKKEKKLTISQLLEGFNITDIALRRHIHQLERDGLVTSSVEKQELGRPFYVYELTEKGDGLFPSHYQQLSEDLLQQIKELNGEDFIYQLFRSRAEKDKQEYQLHLEGLASFEDRVNALANAQTNKGYMTELNHPSEETFVLEQYNCPISSIAKEYQAICQIEADLFQEVLGEGKVSPVNCMTNGSKCCSFLIEKK